MSKLIVIEGPTAVGKTTYAIDVALANQTEIISADSRQFYKELNIGVARPSPEELAAVKHHFIAHLSIHDYYSVSKFEQDVLTLLEQLFQTKEIVVMTGGSGMYVQAVCEGIDDFPDADETLRSQLKNDFEKQGVLYLREQLKALDPIFYEQVDLDNPKRLMRALEVCLMTGKPYSEQRTKSKKERPFAIERWMVNRPKEILYERINQRVDLMMEQGLQDEAMTVYPYKELNALNTVGYKELFAYFDGHISLEQAVIDIKTHSRRYAKRQLTWLRKQPITKVINL